MSSAKKYSSSSLSLSHTHTYTHTLTHTHTNTHTHNLPICLSLLNFFTHALIQSHTLHNTHQTESLSISLTLYHSLFHSNTTITRYKITHTYNLSQSLFLYNSFIHSFTHAQAHTNCVFLYRWRIIKQRQSTLLADMLKFISLEDSNQKKILIIKHFHDKIKQFLFFL